MAGRVGVGGGPGGGGIAGWLGQGGGVVAGRVGVAWLAGWGLVGVGWRGGWAGGWAGMGRCKERSYSPNGCIQRRSKERARIWVE